MSEGEYELVAERVRGSSMIVFGLGNDSDLWREICSSVLFVETDPKWFQESEDSVLLEIDGKVDQWVDEVCVHEGIAAKFDYCLIDGPKGDSPEATGRQLPIYWSTFLAPIILVHDFDRAWERECCSRYLGEPDEVFDRLAIFSNNLR